MYTNDAIDDTVLSLGVPPDARYLSAGELFEALGIVFRSLLFKKQVLFAAREDLSSSASRIQEPESRVRALLQASWHWQQENGMPESLLSFVS